MDENLFKIKPKSDGDNRSVAIACRLDSPKALKVVQFITDYLLQRKEKISYETRISSKFIRHFAKNFVSIRFVFHISIPNNKTVMVFYVVNSLPCFPESLIMNLYISFVKENPDILQ